MLDRLAKQAVRGVAGLLGLEVHRLRRPTPAPPPAPPAPPPERAVHGEFTEPFLRHLARCGVRPRCILDVGANEGKWARAAASVFPDARLVLIEPQQELLPKLKAFCASHPSARYVLAGAGAENGQAVQTIWEDLHGSSFLPPTDDNLLRAGRQRVTPIVTLNTVVAEEERLPEVVKLDVQGYELEALRGAGRLLGTTECFILEVSLFSSAPNSPELFEVVEFMHRHDYEVYDICGFLRRPLDGAIGQLDLAFARANGRLRRDHRWSAEYSLVTRN
jgi:FkbM family methyltransferase